MATLPESIADPMPTDRQEGLPSSASIPPLSPTPAIAVDSRDDTAEVAPITQEVAAQGIAPIAQNAASPAETQEVATQDMAPLPTPQMYDIVSIIEVIPGGVLGDAVNAGKTKEVWWKPEQYTLVVDPAGLRYIQQLGPSKASGASGAIYRWLDIHHNASFPTTVKNGLKDFFQALEFAYSSSKHILHVLGPDFNKDHKHLSREDAVEVLAQTYFNIWRSYIKSTCKNIRVPPLAGGINAGDWKQQIVQLTMDALLSSFKKLGGENRDKLVAKGIMQLCIFDQSEHDQWAAAVAEASLSKAWPKVRVTQQRENANFPVPLSPSTSEHATTAKDENIDTNIRTLPQTQGVQAPAEMLPQEVQDTCDTCHEMAIPTVLLLNKCRTRRAPKWFSDLA